jgi:hypothetical protein
VRDSLGFHGQAPSLLNPEARVTRSLDNRPATDGTEAPEGAQS